MCATLTRRPGVQAMTVRRTPLQPWATNLWALNRPSSIGTRTQCDYKTAAISGLTSVQVTGCRPTWVWSVNKKCN